MPLEPAISTWEQSNVVNAIPGKDPENMRLGLSSLPIYVSNSDVNHIFSRQILSVFLLSLLFSVSSADAARIHVNSSAGSGGDGSSWASAYSKLSTALSVAQSGDEIWVAAGTYRPDLPSTPTARSNTFTLVSGVAVYGGFNGVSNVFADRDFSTNLTVLSGDLNSTPANITDDVYHVLTATDVNSATILDGFTITKGYADGGFPQSSGAGLLSERSSLSVANCVFTANTSLRLGGAVYVGNIQGNTDTPSFTDCQFTANAASAGSGGGLFTSLANVTLTRCTFTANTSSSDAGGLYIQDTDTFSIIDSTFTSNDSGRQGGAVLIEDSEPIFNNCDFTTNTAAFNGGAIYSQRSDPQFADCDFLENTTEDGGAVFLSGSSAIFTDSTFTRNGASATGGAVRAVTTFSNSTTTLSDPSFQGCTFTDNTGGSSGALELNGSENNFPTPLIDDCIFDGNSSSGNGGAVTLKYCSPTVSDSTFDDNSISGEFAAGGAISLFRIETAVIEDCSFTANSASGGGAIDLNNGALTVTRCDFLNNSATRSAGAMSLNSDGASTIVSDCSFVGSSAGSGGFGASGGAVALLGTIGETPLFENCEFRGNSTSTTGLNRGGAMSFNGSSPTLVGCLFSGNFAGDEGGAIRFSGDNIALINCTVVGNSSGRFGAIEISGNSGTFSNCIVYGNKGDSGSTTSPVDSISDGNNSALPISTFTHSLVANYSKADLDSGASPDTNFEPTDPLFVDPPDAANAPTTLGNLALMTGSPAIDSGSNAATSLTLDLAGNTRVFNTIIDLGPLENQGPDPFFDDVDGDGTSGGVETAIGTNPDVSDTADARHFRVSPDVPGLATFGYDPSTASSITLELRRSTDLITFDVVITSSDQPGFPLPGSGGIVTVTDPSPPAGKAFYRLQATQK